jgi:hypothetical protein
MIKKEGCEEQRPPMTGPEEGHGATIAEFNLLPDTELNVFVIGISVVQGSIARITTTKESAKEERRGRYRICGTVFELILIDDHVSILPDFEDTIGARRIIHLDIDFHSCPLVLLEVEDTAGEGRTVLVIAHHRGLFAEIIRMRNISISFTRT